MIFGPISFKICYFQISIWASVNKKNDMTWSRTLGIAPSKFDKLTSTCGHTLSYAKQGPYIENCIFYVENFVAIILSLIAMKNSQK